MKVKYVVAGGVAVVFHGFPRFTKDLDLMVWLEEGNLDKFYEALRILEYQPKVPVTKEQFLNGKIRKRWQNEKGMVVFSFVSKVPPFDLIDMFIDEPVSFKEVYRNKIKVKIDDGVTVPLMSIDHLRRLKQIANRPQDLIDIAQLKAIQKEMRHEKKKTKD